MCIANFVAPPSPVDVETSQAVAACTVCCSEDEEASYILFAGEKDKKPNTITKEIITINARNEEEGVFKLK
ncbi:hypothetical protein EON63_02975 [archaeon]|nr:MAG: hypothetical protein EON63_02975 [archaeon]